MNLLTISLTLPQESVQKLVEHAAKNEMSVDSFVDFLVSVADEAENQWGEYMVLMVAGESID